MLHYDFSYSVIFNEVHHWYPLLKFFVSHIFIPIDIYSANLL